MATVIDGTCERTMFALLNNLCGVELAIQIFPIIIWFSWTNEINLNLILTLTHLFACPMPEKVSPGALAAKEALSYRNFYMWLPKFVDCFFRPSLRFLNFRLISKSLPSSQLSFSHRISPHNWILNGNLTW